jgi:hypothetical protein
MKARLFATFWFDAGFSREAGLCKAGKLRILSTLKSEIVANDAGLQIEP